MNRRSFLGFLFAAPMAAPAIAAGLMSSVSTSVAPRDAAAGIRVLDGEGGYLVPQEFVDPLFDLLTESPPCAHYSVASFPVLSRDRIRSVDSLRCALPCGEGSTATAAPASGKQVSACLTPAPHSFADFARSMLRAERMRLPS